MIGVRELTALDTAWKRATLEAAWGSTIVARLGVQVNAAPLSGLVAERHGRRLGLATYAARANGIEVVTLQALTQGEGVGRALMDHLRTLATESGASRLWLITTNDNVRAIAFYQQWGMHLVRLVHDGVAASRRVKPSIPTVGATGIQPRHELEFELRVATGVRHTEHHLPTGCTGAPPCPDRRCGGWGVDWSSLAEEACHGHGV